MVYFTFSKLRTFLFPVFFIVGSTLSMQGQNSYLETNFWINDTEKPNNDSGNQLLLIELDTATSESLATPSVAESSLEDTTPIYINYTFNDTISYSSKNTTVPTVLNQSDWDNDGLIDSIDLDDDNDGISDMDEGCISTVQSEFFGTFGTLAVGVNFRDLQNPPGGGSQYSPGVNGLVLSASYAVVNQTGADISHPSELWNFPGHTTGDGDDAFLAVNGSTTQGVFFSEVLSLTNGINYTFGIWHSAGIELNIPYSLLIRVIRVSNGQVVAMADTGNVTEQVWTPHTLNFIPTVSEDFRFEILNTSFNGGGNDFAIDDITIIAECTQDNDQDGIPNFKDLDSDNDGITDVIESGGIDTNGDGLADDDDDNIDNNSSDGVPTSAGSGNQPINTDGVDDFDFLDIDADNDGIQDNIEAQTTTNYVAPSGIDMNQNGIDDIYDPGNNLITPIDTDGDDNPDYLDLNSDDDCLDDSTEAYDLDQDGIPDISPSGNDSDNDGLDNAYDMIILDASTSFTNPTDNGETPGNFPDIQNPGNDIDFREEFVLPNAGTNGTINLCNSDAVLDLFTLLGGTPDTGGSWTPTLTSGTGFFDPAVDVSDIYTYTVTSLCGTATATVDVTVITPPNFMAVSTDCVGNFYEIIFTSDVGSIINVSAGQVDIANSRIFNIPNNTDVEVSVSSAILSTCTIIQTIQAPDCICPEITIPNPDIICVDTNGIPLDENDFPVLETNLDPTDFMFTWLFNGVQIANETSSSLITTEPGEYEVFFVAIGDDTCNGIASAVVNFAQGPEQLTLALTNDLFSLNNGIVATVVGDGTYEYALDDGPYQLSNRFDNVSLGLHEISVMSIEGCGFMSEEIFVLGFPNFFTPNSDGINDMWNIVKDPEIDIPEIEISIFDRYGRLITRLGSESTGWDGNYDGKPMPANDYWFTANLKDGSTDTFRSHFTLIR